MSQPHHRAAISHGTSHGVSQRRPGVALALAIGAIVVIGALIAGVFFASTQEYRIGRNSLLETRALTATEYGMYAMVATAGSIADSGWNTQWNGMLGNGQMVTRVYSPGSGATDTVRLTRLNTKDFLLVSEGIATLGGTSDAEARRRIGALVTLATPNMKFLGALTSRGATKIGGSSLIDGNDHVYSGWGCPAAGPALPGLTVQDVSMVSTSGCKSLSCLDGDPKVAEDPAAADTSTYFQYGDMDWATLTASASKIIPAGGSPGGVAPQLNADGTCNTTPLGNWGDPTKAGACANYFPIIYAKGDLSLSGGIGQGILLVEGDLSVQGGAEFFGPVIVRGMLKTTGTGGHFNGGVMAANVDLDQNTVLGNAVINYSSCVLNAALTAAATPMLAGQRAWVELF
ncbi:MAG TPA: hypothetical protein VFK13_02470 [Gemmatimonadaceae bacterium]|nr:hypothetical protein [Gemmatimonadaceae bacterium]